MRKIYLATLFSLMAAAPLLAQPAGRRYSPAYGVGTQSRWNDYDRETYLGLRLSLAVASVHSDDSRLDGGGGQSGINFGVVSGIRLGEVVPIYFEGGLQFTQKGGRGYTDGKKFTYDLDYLEIPLVIKYKHFFADEMAIQPFFGGFIACGVGGKIKNFEDRETHASFSRTNFRRFDGGLKIGCGFSYTNLYVDLGYDIGLANICHDVFDKSHTGCFYATLGVDF